MALQVNLPTTSIGIPCPEAYARITDVYGDKNDVRIMVSIYANAAAREANAQPVWQESHHVAVAELPGDLFPAMYEWLKANVELFADALDV